MGDLFPPISPTLTVTSVSVSDSRMSTDTFGWAIGSRYARQGTGGFLQDHKNTFSDVLLVRLEEVNLTLGSVASHRF